MFNKIVAPASDKFIRSQMRVGAFGDDCPGMTILGVSSNPTPHIEQSFLLSDKISLELKNRADEHMNVLTPHLRTALTKSTMQFSDLFNILDTSVEITGNELIHTSYFANEDICNLLVGHMVKKTNGNNISESKDIANWLNDFYAFSKDGHKEINRKADQLLETLSNRKIKERIAQGVGGVLGGSAFLLILNEIFLVGS